MTAPATKHEAAELRFDVHQITPPKFSDLWQTLGALPNYTSLLRVFVLRMFSVRYRQSLLGALWVGLQPVATTLVIFFMFSIIGAETSGGAPKGLFLLIGVITWQFFARAVQDGTGSLVTNSAILTKVFIPRLLFPLASIIAAWLDLLVMLLLLLAVCVLYGIPLSGRLLVLPCFLVLVSFAALAIAIILSPINALYRDIGFVIPFALQFGMFLTPVFYTAAYVPQGWKALYYLNPMATLVEGVRWSILPESAPPDLLFLAVNVGTIIIMFMVGLVIFQKLESIVVDRI